MLPKRKYRNPDQIPLQGGEVFDAPIYEKAILDTWLRVKPGTIFNDIHGSPIMVINPGIINHNEGPDIYQAVIFADGKFITGNIECHVRARDWYYHGHEGDPKYQNIILHITGIPDQADDQLNRRLIHLSPQGAALSCDLHRSNARLSKEKSIVEFGLDRWFRRVQQYQSHHWKEYALKDSFRLLGKGGNEANFLRVLDLFQQGLAPNDAAWPVIQWRHRGIRPGGWPEKRILVAQHMFKLINAFSGPPVHIPSRMKLQVSQNLYVELTGNIFNPLAAAACLQQGGYESYQRLKLDWLNLKLGYSYKRFERQFSSVLTASQLKSFPILQGLLELEQLFCKAQHCIVCPLKKSYGHLDQG